MEPTTLYFVFSNPIAGMDDEFNDWYDNVHLPDLLSIPGIVSAQRFALWDAAIVRDAGWTPEHRYMVVYEIDGDPDEIMSRVRQAVAEGKVVMSASLDVAGARMSFWSARGTKRLAER